MKGAICNLLGDQKRRYCFLSQFGRREPSGRACIRIGQSPLNSRALLEAISQLFTAEFTGYHAIKVVPKACSSVQQLLGTRRYLCMPQKLSLYKLLLPSAPCQSCSLRWGHIHAALQMRYLARPVPDHEVQQGPWVDCRELRVSGCQERVKKKETMT